MFPCRESAITTVLPAVVTIAYNPMLLHVLSGAGCCIQKECYCSFFSTLNSVQMALVFCCMSIPNSCWRAGYIFEDVLLAIHLITNTKQELKQCLRL